MEDIEKEYKKILNKLEKVLKDDPNSERVKSEFINLFVMFFNEIDSLKEKYEEKITVMLDRQSYFNEKITNLEEQIKKLESEIMEDDDSFGAFFEDDELDEDEDFNDEYEDEECVVICPYCNEEIYLSVELSQKEIKCPYCNQMIELDWDELYTENGEDDDM